MERYLTDWVPFAFGRTLLLSARIDGGPSGTSSFDLGSGEVALSALQSSALVTVTLPGGALGLRLVLPRLFANLTLASPINLGIFNALVNNAGNNLVTLVVVAGW